MNVLIVDDQINVVSSLKSGVDWDMLGAKNVYTALDVPRAKDVISTHPIDILLSDIEMPVENGLSLLRWCRKHGYTCECIFLTAHADFFYAQEAIQLGSFDYILQPARYEDVENAVKKAMLRIQESQKGKIYTEYGKVALSHKHILLKGILHEWFTGKDTDVSGILNALKNMQIILKPESKVFLFWLQILSWSAEPQDISTWSSCAENLLSDIFSRNRYHILSYCPDKVSMGVLVYGDSKEAMPFEIYNSLLNLASIKICRALSCTAAFYTAPSFELQVLSSYAKAIQQEKIDNILLTPGIFFAKQGNSSHKTTYCGIDQQQRYELYMAGQQAERAEKEALTFLENLSQNNLLNQDTLSAFCKDYLQAAYIAAQKLNLPAHAIPCQEELSYLSESKTLTLENVTLLIKKLTAFFQTITPKETEKNNALNKIVEYVHKNLDKPLSCPDIANVVYLTPDYITRLLQKEKGLSLKEYVMEEKMKAARNLLITTTLPISVIAAKVGYDNFSHFSKIYKKVMGVTPSSERNKDT